MVTKLLSNQNMEQVVAMSKNIDFGKNQEKAIQLISRKIDTSYTLDQKLNALLDTNVKAFNYLVFEDSEGKTIVNQRTEKGIWLNLYEFPVIELDEIIEEDEIFELINKKNSDIIHISILPEFEIIHKLSHQKLHIQFIKVSLKKTLPNGLSIKDLKKLPFPIVIHNFIERFFS